MMDSDIVRLGLEAGFSISSYYGQDSRQLMPMTDIHTLKNFARLLQEELRRTQVNLEEEK